ncbi:MAG: protein BatD [Lewinellaceae bacterium]|nr:protein BatD [Lewinellaceae bacterium]
MKRFGLLGWMLLFLSWGAWAQRSPVFEAFSDAEQVLLNGYFEVTYTLRNGEGKDFTPPNFDRDFIVLAGPSRSMSTTVINGQMASEMAFSYSLQPRRVGTFTLGAASIKVNGRTYTSNRLRIEVLAGGVRQEDAKEEYFVRAILSTEEAFIGQQIRLDYKLFTTREIQNYNIVEESDYVGFYAEDIKRPDSRIRREIIKGREYYTRVLRSIALYPQQAGKLTIEPAIMQLGVVVEDPRRSGGIFFGNDVRRVPVRTDPVSVTVKPLAGTPPASFQGGVGQFTLNSSISRTELSTDDAVSLTLVITGDGDLKRIAPPKLNLPASFEIYEPKVTEVDLGEAESLRIGQKSFEYLILPKEPGAFTLEPAFTCFSPDSNRFVTLRNNAYTLQVRPGTKSNASDQNKQADGLSNLRPLKTAAHLHRPGSSLQFGQPLFWVLALLPIIALGGIVTVRYRKLQQANLDPQLRRKQEARKVALERLTLAERYRQEGQPRQFYDELSKAMLHYVSDKLNIPRGQLSKITVQDKLAELGVTAEHQQRFLRIRQQCDMALFAGQSGANAMEEIYQDALALLAAIEERA